jgi:hypothetical protein
VHLKRGEAEVSTQIWEKEWNDGERGKRITITIIE